MVPVTADESWSAHFIDNTWGSPQEQVDADYPLYAQPTVSNGKYTEVFDFGKTLASSNVTLSINDVVVHTDPTVSTHISTSHDGSSWQRNTYTLSIYATNCHN